MPVKVTWDSLQDAVREGILSSEQAEALYHHLERQPGSGPAFSFTNILYYFGGLTAIGAMTLFMNLGWEQFGGWGIRTGLRRKSAYNAKGNLGVELYLRDRRSVMLGSQRPQEQRRRLSARSRLPDPRCRCCD